ncbi:Luciferase-like monooxygenase [Lentzea albidocapillata subsp. violacea]|uniref:Luciferase-like monooxygenase n=1 Tax=Lentzea albidocapillata subsp. violacea TaxID=128104 RepID=A0A1G8RSA3_9PSEU|nr:LLM class flavin-dependent oxidoreductase [Lentzea albidocapillata]SDJ19375.1 Luciferase-like monooxygenase [Lentzea albidocapillata subsp. violacea]
MRFAIYVPSFGSELGDPSVLVSLAVEAEASGWDGFFLWDHVVVPGESVVSDVWVTLGAVAARTSRISLGPLVTSLGRRRPWKVALEASTLQRLSGGRLVLGVGAGVPQDYSPFGERGSRAEAMSEGVELLRALLSGAEVEHHGALFDVSGVRFAPVEVPIWVGGIWPRSTPFRAAEHAAGVVPATFGAEGLVVLSPADAARLKADFVASGGPADGDVVLWGGSALPEVSGYEAAGVTWMLSDGGARGLDELRAFVAAGPPRSGV